MDLNHLRYFQAIARSGSMSGAARELGVSQPTLTVAMQQLEERLGARVFLRERSGVKLTASGEELLRVAAEVFEIVGDAERRIRAIEQEDVGEFVVGCHESLGAYFLPPFMSAFLREHPGIVLSLSNDSSMNTQRAVLERKVDFGIVVNPIPQPDLVIVEMFHDAMDILVAEGAPPPSLRVDSARLRLRAESDPPDLAAAKHRLRAGPLIYAGRISQSQELIDLLAAEGLVPTRRLVCGDLELVKSLALSGLGVAILPRRVGAYGHEGKLRRLHATLPFFPDTICLVYRADMHRTRAAMRVKDGLVAYGRSLDALPDPTQV